MDEKYHEQACALTQTWRDAALRAAHASLQGAGQDDCETCNQPIPPKRRQAMPSAIRCAACQTIFESKGKPHAISR